MLRAPHLMVDNSCRISGSSDSWRVQDTGFNLKAGFMFGEPRSDLNPTLDPAAAVPDPDVAFSVPRQFDDAPDDNLQYWGRANTNYLVGEGYTGAGRR